jgi:hypothetical protein
MNYEKRLGFLVKSYPADKTGFIDLVDHYPLLPALNSLEYHQHGVDGVDSGFPCFLEFHHQRLLD